MAAPPSVYSEETYKSFSSMKTISGATASLLIAAVMLTMCGGLTTGLSFYMMYAVSILIITMYVNYKLTSNASMLARLRPLSRKIKVAYVFLYIIYF